ncbi:MAG: hypothetical protein WC322_05680 [Candidatus Paceibacterota bacterium]|jgi:hypothetical protein
MSQPAGVKKAPVNSASFDKWMAAGKQWKHQCKSFRKSSRRLFAHMNNPGGSGAARWWPLAQYVGWPRSQKANVIRCIDLESSGCEKVPNASGTPCYGLMQIWCYTQNQIDRMKVAINNLRAGLKKWRAYKWTPWPTMAGC